MRVHDAKAAASARRAQASTARATWWPSRRYCGVAQEHAHARTHSARPCRHGHNSALAGSPPPLRQRGTRCGCFVAWNRSGDRKSCCRQSAVLLCVCAVLTWPASLRVSPVRNFTASLKFDESLNFTELQGTLHLLSCAQPSGGENGGGRREQDAAGRLGQ